MRIEVFRAFNIFNSFRVDNVNSNHKRLRQTTGVYATHRTQLLEGKTNICYKRPLTRYTQRTLNKFSVSIYVSQIKLILCCSFYTSNSQENLYLKNEMIVLIKSYSTFSITMDFMLNYRATHSIKLNNDQNVTSK